MKALDLDHDDDMELPPAEAARDRRRDHDLRAPEREGMRTGLAKQFKQVLDLQVKRGREAEDDLLPDNDRTYGQKGSHRPRRAIGPPPERP